MSHDRDDCCCEASRWITRFVVQIQQFVTAITNDLGIFTNSLRQNAHRKMDRFTCVICLRMQKVAQRSSRQRITFSVRILHTR